MRKIIFLLASVVPLVAQQNIDDPLLKAMADEIKRSADLRLPGSNPYPPYYVEYGAEKTVSLHIGASLGGLITANKSKYVNPRVQVRIGNYKLDNTNFVNTGMSTGANYDAGQWAFDADYGLMRQQFWLATDRAYKSAVEALSRKMAALKDVTQSEPLNDFAEAKPVVKILAESKYGVSDEIWKKRVVEYSKIFLGYPQLLSSGVEFDSIQDTSYFANSEGSSYRVPESVAHLRARAVGYTPDGSYVWDSVSFPAETSDGLPAESEIQRMLAEVAQNTTALQKAPLGTAYTGPVLFEPQAAGQLMIQLFANELRLSRNPVAPQGRPVNTPQSDWSTRLGGRVLPDIFTVRDIPNRFFPNGKGYLGNFDIDLEGVEPKPLTIIEKGSLKSFLYTRLPVRGHEGSNGRARFPGDYGSKATFLSNVEVSASESQPMAELKKQLIDMMKKRSKDFGLIVRKLDYPSAAPGEELQKMVGAARAAGANSLLSLPALVYKVYPDGREELVRGLRFRGVTGRSMRDVIAASKETALFSYFGTNTALTLLASNGFVNGVTIEAPGLLFDELELEQPQTDKPRLPVVPPPSFEN